MSFEVGIIGLPNAGKSTLFKALTREEVDIASYSFTTIDPNVGIVKVPDQRLDKIEKAVKPDKVTPTVIKFVDIAGLVKNAHKGEGLGNQFLAQIRECEALVHVLRSFQTKKINKEPDIKKDIKTIENELLMKDLETTERALEKDLPQKKEEILLKIKEGLLNEKTIRSLDLKKDSKNKIKEYQFLTAKPVLYLLNVNDKNKGIIKNFPNKNFLSLDIKMEDEIQGLNEKEKQELGLESNLDQLIVNCYNILNLITFFTVKGGKETRAWTVEKGSSCPEAGEKVHSDFKENFIKARTINWKQLVEAGSFKNARNQGLVKTVGKDYIVQDGDIIEFLSD